jgi:ribosomal protein L37AE/L43A
MDKLNETYSDKGPQCPYCGNQFTADDSFYYDESKYTEEECPSCEKTFDVSVYTSTTWTCTARAALGEEKK